MKININNISAIIGVVSIGLMLGILTGCATSGIEGNASAVKMTDGGTQLSKYVIVNNPKLARSIQIVNLQQSYVGDLLKAQVSLVSKNSKTLNFQYKFAWFDGQGVEINLEGSPWTPLVFYGFETKSLQAVAPNPSAREFKIKIRSY